MNPAVKRFARKYGPIADAISRLDIAQVDREAVADAITDAIAGNRHQADFHATTFRLIARDPLVPCCGYTLHETGEHVDCPEGVELRIAMHDKSQPDGRNVAWRERLPVGVRCVSCGAMEFSAEFQRNRLAREAVAS